ncbi:branched-chain amino acid ABC transporter permease [Sanguibacter sp. 25GB23B1]|uniref:branched-chain amino acid ABC transporter permease n=1 Tax=unclassified Sanguibacter TaxID=2645534 RepID=UPI0032AEFA50
MSVTVEDKVTPADAARPGPVRSDLAASGRRVLIALAGLVLAIGGTFLLDPYRNYQLAVVAAYLCATAGLTVLIGRGGQLSLGHAALIAAGAYSFGLTSNAMDEQGITGVALVVVPMLVGVVAASVLGVLLGLAAARLHGPYLAGLTLAVVVAIPAVTSTFSSVLGGDAGLYISVQRRPEALDRIIAVEQWQAWVAITAAAAVLFVLSNLVRSSYGQRMVAVRDDEAAARLVGIDTTRVKVAGFTISAGCAGLGGGVLAYVTQNASPGAFSLVFSLFLVVAVVIGGLGSLRGALWGALLIVLLPDVIGTVLDSLDLPPELAQRLDGNVAVLVFGLLLVTIMIVAPHGIQGWLSSLRRPRRRAPRTAPALSTE